VQWPTNLPSPSLLPPLWLPFQRHITLAAAFTIHSIYPLIPEKRERGREIWKNKALHASSKGSIRATLRVCRTYFFCFCSQFCHTHTHHLSFLILPPSPFLVPVLLLSDEGWVYERKEWQSSTKVFLFRERGRERMCLHKEPKM
jgi:hypothetical protein